MAAGLQKLDLSSTLTPHQELLDRLAGLSRLTALLMGKMWPARSQHKVGSPSFMSAW